MKIDEMIAYATNKYDDVSHPLAVANAFKPLSDEWIVGLFHDIIEDGFATSLELLDFLRRYDSIHAYHEVIRITRKDGEKYFDYIRRLKTHDDVSRVVKIADLKHNLSRTDTLKPSLKKRYTKALDIIKVN